MGSPRRFDAALAILLAAALASSGWLAANLVCPDLNLAYPFLGGDGREWISNALAWSGEGVRFTARPPLLPLLLAGLEKLGARGWLLPLSADMGSDRT